MVDTERFVRECIRRQREGCWRPLVRQPEALGDQGAQGSRDAGSPAESELQAARPATKEKAEIGPPPWWTFDSDQAARGAEEG